jgi:predicted metal-dependent hydrolase
LKAFRRSRRIQIIPGYGIIATNPEQNRSYRIQVKSRWAARIGVNVLQIHLRQMTSKWASISTAGRLTLNTDLIALPKELGELVIVHELAHLLAPNHGKVFKSSLYAYLPDWQEREE